MSNAAETPETQPVKCSRCKRTLTSAASRALGIGPRCAAIEAAFRGLKPEQADKARELIADGGVVPTGHKGVYRIASGKGDAVYLTAVTGQCTCAHGLRVMTAKPCYHVGAARLAAKPVQRSMAKAA
jgi:hypothetical protein